MIPATKLLTRRCLIVLTMVAVIWSAALARQTGAPAKAFSAPRADAMLSQVTAQLERDVPQLMKESDVPGLSMALVRDGEIAWVHAFGVKNSETKEAVTDDTVFEAAS